MLLIGNSGTGKTHLATALAYQACAQGLRVRFSTVTGLVTRLLERREERQLEHLRWLGPGDEELCSEETGDR